MPEKIGLIAELDLSKFNRAVSTYISQVGKLQTSSQNVARAVSSSFSGMGNQVTASLSAVASGISAIRTQQNTLRSGLGVYTSLTQRLNNVANAAQRAQARLVSMNAAAGGGGIGGMNLGGVFNFGNMFSGLGAGIGGASRGIGNLIGSVTRPMAAIAGVVGGVTRSFTGLAGVVTSSVTGIIGSVSGLAGVFVRTFGSIVGVVGSVIRSFVGLTSTIAGVVGGIIRSVAGLAGTVVRAFSGMVSGVLRIVGSLTASIGIAFNTILRTVMSIVNTLVSSVIRLFSSLLSSVMRIVGSIVSGIVSAFTGIVSAVGRALSSLVSAVTNIFSGILRAVTSIVGNLVSAVVGLFGEMARRVLGVVGDMVQGVVSAVQGMVTKTISVLKGLAGNILSAYRDVGGEIIKIVTATTLAVTGALVLAGRKFGDWLGEGIRGAADFEQGMADIAAVLRKTRDEVEPLADKITELGLDPELVVSTGEAASVVEQLARNGLEMTQVLEGAAEAAILLANATGGDFALAANTATMAMQMFGLQASEVNRIADVSQGVINNSRIDLEDWALALGNGGAAAAAVGVTFEDFATTIAGTVNLFHSARQAGTGAMNFFQRLVPITQVAADAFRDVGLFTGLTGEEFEEIATEIAETEKRIAELDPRLVHYDELIEAHTRHLDELKKQMVAGNSAFFDAQGNFEGTKNAAIALATAVKDLSAEERIEFGRRTFGNDALETFIGLVAMGEKELAGLEGGFTDIHDEITISNSAMEAAAVRTRTLQSRWRNLGDIWETIQRQAGDKFQPTLLKIVNELIRMTNLNQGRIIDFFGEMANLFTRLVDKAMPFIERMIPMLIDNLEALGYYILAVVEDGDTMNDWLSKMSPWLRTTVERVIGAVNWMRRFASEIMAMVGALRETFRPAIEFILNNVQLKDVLLAAAGAIALRLVPGILRLAGTFFLVTRGIAMIRRAWETDWGGIRSFFEQTWPKIRGPIIDFINNFLTGRWRDAWQDALEVITIMLSELEKAVPPFFKNFINLISDVFRGDWRGAWQNLVEISRASLALIIQLLEDLETPFTDFIVDVLRGAWGRVWEQVKKTAIGAFRIVSAYAIQAFDEIKERIAEMDHPFARFITSLLEGRWYDAWRQARQVVVDAFNDIVDYLDSFDNPFTEFLVDLIRGRWFEAWEDAKQIFFTVRDAILFALDELNLPFGNFIANILRGQWEEAWRKIGNVAATAFELIKTMLRDFDQPWSEFLLDILEGRWREVWTTLQTLAINGLELLKQYLPGWGDSFISAVQLVLQGRWLEAWNAARDGAVGILEEIKNFTPSWLDPFISALQLVLQGKWIDAWREARHGVNLTLDELKNNVPGWMTPWITAVQAILNGDWRIAWDNAVTGVKNALQVLKDIVPDWMDPFITAVENLLSGDFKGAWAETVNGIIGILDIIKNSAPTWLQPLITTVQQVLAGDFTGAWNTAASVATGALDTIKAWVEQQGQAVWQWFNKTMPEAALATQTGFNNVKAAWDTFIAAATDTQTTVNLDHLAAVVITSITTAIEGLLQAGTAIVLFLKGDWKGGWEQAQVAIKTFGELPVLNIIADWFNTTFPDAADKFLEKMVLVRDAWEPVAEKWPETWKTIQGWWDSTAKPFIDRSVSAWTEYFTVMVAQLGLFAQAIEELISGEGSIGDKIARAGELMSQAWGLTIDLLKKDLADYGVTLGETSKTTGEDIGTSLNEGFVSGIDGTTEEALQKMREWAEEVQNTPKSELDVKSPSGKFAEIAKYTMEGFRDGILQHMQITFDAAGEMTREFVLRFNVILRDIPPMAAEMLRQFSGLFRQNLHLVYDLVGEFVDAVSDRLAQLGDRGRTAGELMAGGIVNGLRSRLEEVKAVAAEMAAAAEAGVVTEAQIQSPSKVFMRLGKFMREGLMEGFRGSGNGSEWQLALGRAGSAALQHGQGLRSMGNSLTNNYSYNTTSAPVQIGPIYVSHKMDMAEFEYRVEQIIDRRRV